MHRGPLATDTRAKWRDREARRGTSRALAHRVPERPLTNLRWALVGFASAGDAFIERRGSRGRCGSTICAAPPRRCWRGLASASSSRSGSCGIATRGSRRTSTRAWTSPTCRRGSTGWGSLARPRLLVGRIVQHHNERVRLLLEKTQCPGRNAASDHHEQRIAPAGSGVLLDVPREIDRLARALPLQAVRTAVLIRHAALVATAAAEQRDRRSDRAERQNEGPTAASATNARTLPPRTRSPAW